jgi:DNA-directed RNA polymerase subunit RPC12/RpoP
MKTEHVQILDHNGNPIPKSKALLWGNNAAWICPSCGELVGARTSSSQKEKKIECRCGKAYLLSASPNKKGVFRLGSAETVREAA